MMLSPKAHTYLLILRWVIALIFLKHGLDKLHDPTFGAGAQNFFYSFNDDLFFKPYKIFLNDFVVPNAYIFASIIKFGELALALAYFIGWPLKTATLGATFLHINYMAIAKNHPTLLFLNILMLAAEWAITHVFDSKPMPKK